MMGRMSHLDFLWGVLSCQLFPGLKPHWGRDRASFYLAEQKFCKVTVCIMLPFTANCIYLNKLSLGDGKKSRSHPWSLKSALPVLSMKTTCYYLVRSSPDHFCSGHSANTIYQSLKPLLKSVTFTFRKLNSEFLHSSSQSHCWWVLEMGIMKLVCVCLTLACYWIKRWK